MKKHRKHILWFLLVGVIIVLWKFFVEEDYLSFRYLKEHRQALRNFVDTHYVLSVLGYISLYLSTALFLPGALILTVAGGILFGTVQAVLYINIAATAGAVLAFLITRLFIGEWVQEKFREELLQFNREVARHGCNYLLTLRIIPVIPFFVVNYVAGITNIPFRTFVWTTSVGMLPGSIVYAYAGEQLSTIDSPKDLFSPEITGAFVVLSLFALLPVIIYHVKHWKH